MARDRELALRVRLSPSIDAVVGRNGVHLLRGREAFYLDPKAARKLADVYTEIGEAGGFDAIGAVLPSPNGRATAD